MTDTDLDPDLDRTRRRFARRQRARRWLRWRPIALLLTLLLLAGLALYAVYFSPWLRVDGVEVRGADRLSSEEIEAVADVPIDDPLALVDLDRIEYRVGALAAVREASASRRWPHGVRIEVEERQPVAVVRVGSRLRGLDAEGVSFGSFRRVPDHLPEVRSQVSDDDETGTDALREAAAVAGSLDSGLLEIVDHLEVVTRDQITLRLHDGSQVRWGSAEESAQKARVLQDLLEAEPDAPVYDVSVPGSPTTSTG